MARELRRHLNKTDKTWGLISVAGYREFFPPPSSPVIVVDEKGTEYPTKMHSKSARIDGLTDWYYNHAEAEVGDPVLIKIEDSGRIHIALEKELGVVDAEGSREAILKTTPHEQSIEIVPSLERTLEDVLEKNIEKLEAGLHLYVDDEGIPGRQYSTDVAIIDLLCIDAKNDFVVVEIKKEAGGDCTIGQIAKYMGWVKKNLVAANQKVRGIIVTKEVDEKLAYALEVMPAVQARQYQIDLTFI